MREQLRSWAHSVQETCRDEWKVVLTLLAATLLFSFPSFFSQGVFPSGIDTPAHIFKIELVQQMIAEHGNLFHWTDAWYGGYPFLTIYAPVSYYAATAFDYLVGDITLSFNLFRASLLFLTGFLTYRITRKYMDTGKIVGAAAGILAMSSYPLYNNLYTVGRIPFAVGIVLYLAAIYLLLDPELYAQQLNRHHLELTVVLALLVVAHPMTAYFLAFTGVILLFTHWRNIREIGVWPVAVVTVAVALLSLPYVVTFLRHSFITQPFWIRWMVPPDLTAHLTRQFGEVLPHYFGAVHVGLVFLGLLAFTRYRDRFFRFVSLNFALFYLLFWSKNLGFLQYIPMHGQFDMPRFEIMAAVFTAFLAAYGFKQLLSLFSRKKVKYIAAAVLLLLVVWDVSPMIQESSNWSPRFETDAEALGIDDSYRAMMVGARHWDDYLLPIEIGVRNTNGWFQQADPHYNFTQTLENTAGLWYPTDREFPRLDSPMLRKNLMQLSHTKYLMFGKNWMSEDVVQKEYVLGNYRPFHQDNVELYNQTADDQEFVQIHESNSIDVFELDREMSFCEAVEPVWIDEDYFRQARSLLASEEAFPRVPVQGRNITSEYSTDTAIDCSKTDPYGIEIETDGSAWVLVKESQYPYWYRENGKGVFNAFGFMVTHVNGTGHLVYDTGRDGQGRSIRS